MFSLLVKNLNFSLLQSFCLLENMHSLYKLRYGLDESAGTAWKPLPNGPPYRSPNSIDNKVKITGARMQGPIFKIRLVSL